VQQQTASFSPLSDTPPTTASSSRASTPSSSRGPVLPADAPPPRYPLRRQHVDALIAFNGRFLPTTYQEAINCAEKDQWLKAVHDEWQAHLSNHTWDLVPRPDGVNIVSSKWVFDFKDEDPPRFKARFVARGFSQQYGIDYDETYAPTVRPETLRILFVISARRRYNIHQMDFKTAFLNGTLNIAVYVQQAEGFVDSKHPKFVYLLNKALYGLKQSSREWYVTLRDVLEAPDINFQCVDSDRACFILQTELSTVYLAVYVDDILLFGDDELLINDIKFKLTSVFEMKDLGLVKRFLGLEIGRGDESEVFVSQERYIDRLLAKHGMQESNPVSTPMEASMHLHRRKEDEKPADESLYRSIVGELNHLAVWSRPDLSFSISTLSKFLSDPSEIHIGAAKRLLRYLKGTKTLRLVYSANSTFELSIYADSDWANDPDDRRSISGIISFLGGAPISHSSKKQTLVALSTMEAEYIALSETTKQGIWLRQLCKNLQLFGDRETPAPKVLMVNSDSQSALAAIKNPVHHARTKHFDIRHHFVRDAVENGDITVNYVPSNENPADILTKALSRDKHAAGLRLLHLA